MTVVFIDPIHGAALTAGLLPILPALPCPTCGGSGGSLGPNEWQGWRPCPDCNGCGDEDADGLYAWSEWAVVELAWCAEP